MIFHLDDFRVMKGFDKLTSEDIEQLRRACLCIAEDGRLAAADDPYDLFFALRSRRLSTEEQAAIYLDFLGFGKLTALKGPVPRPSYSRFVLPHAYEVQDLNEALKAIEEDMLKIKKLIEETPDHKADGTYDYAGDSCRTSAKKVLKLYEQRKKEFLEAKETTMHTIVPTDAGVIELNYMWLPTWIGMNGPLKKELEDAIKDKVVGRACNEETLEFVDELVISFLEKKSPGIDGLREYLEGLKFVTIKPYAV